MASFLLKPGERIETLTPGEFAELLSAVADRFTTSPAETLVSPTSQQLSGTGIATWVIGEIPPGFQLTIGYITFEASGFTPGAPYSAAGAYIDLHPNDASQPRIDWTPSNVILPCRFSYGTADAPVIRSATQIVAQVVAGPPNAIVNTVLQGKLEKVYNPAGRP